MNKEYYIKLQAKIDDSSKTITELNKQIKTLENKVSSLEIKVKMPSSTNKGFGDLNSQLNKLQVNMSEFKDNILSTSSTFDTTTTRYTNNAGKILTIQEKMVAGEKIYKATLKEVGSAVETNAKQANKWQYSWSKAFQSFTTYMSVTTVFYQIINTTKEMIQEVTDLDSALVELQKVTDLTGASLKNFTQDAYDAAEAVAKTGTEMVEAATEFAKAGYDENQILKLGELALMYTNIADEEVSAAESAEFMVAQMKAFNVEAEDAIHIIDAVNEVANKYAVSSADIANNLGKSSAVMANAGNSYEQMIGLLTAGTEITRNASKVANGLKTITLRLQGMDDEGEASLELMAQMEALFSKLGLSVYKTDGSLKNTYEILKDLAPVYKEATAAEKAYITETIAGKYQAQNAAAILNNFETALAATETALNSEGSALNENAKYIDSIEGKVSNLKSAFEELSQTLISSDFIKGFVDFGTLLLKIANSDMGRLVMSAAALTIGLKALGGAASGTFGAFKKFSVLISSVSKSINGFNNILSITKNRTDILNLSEKVESQTLKQTKAAMIELGISTDGVNTKKKAQIAINNALKASSLALNAGLMAGSLLISGAITLYQKHKQAEQDAIQQVIDDATNLDSEISDLDNTMSKIKELRKVTDEGTSSYEDTIKAREELIKIQEELRAQYGKEADSIDVVTGSISEQVAELKRLKQEKAQEYVDKNRTSYKDAKEEVYGKKSHSRNMNIGLGNMSNMAGGGSKSEAGINWFLGDSPKNIDDKLLEQKKVFEKYYKDYKEIMGKYGTIQEKKRGTDGSISDVNFITQNVDSSKKALKEWQQYLKEHEKELVGSGLFSQDEFDNAWDYVSKELSRIEEKFGSSYKAIEEYNAKFKDAKGYEQFKDELKNMSSQTAITEKDIKKLLENYPELEAAMKKDGTTVKDLLKIYQNYDDVVDKIGDTLGDDFTKDIQSMIVSNDLSYSSFKKLLENYPELETQLNKYGMSIEDYTNKIGTLVTKQLEWETAVKNFNTSIDDLQSAFNTLSAAQEEYNESGYISIDTLQALLALDDEYLGYLVDENGQLNLNTDAFKSLAQAKINDLIATEEQRHYNAVLAISEQELNNTTKKTIGWFQALWNVIKGGKASVSDATKTLSALEAEINKSGTDAQKAALAAENEKYENRIAILKATLESVNKNFNSAMGVSGPSGGSYGSRGSSSSSSGKEWWETILDNLKDQFKYNEITIEEYINGLDSLLSRVQKGTDAWRKINEELQKQRLTKVEDDYKRGTISLDEYIKKLKELIKAYKQGSDAWNDLADKIKKALQDKADRQKDDMATAEDAAIGIIDEEIEKLNKLKEEQEEYYDQLIKDKEKANEETEKELELARLQEALENAKKEKNKRVWKENIGWIWESDQEAIREAQEALDEFNNEQEIDALEKQKEEAISAIEEQIDAWKKYKESWEDVANDYETQQARIILAQQLGANAEAAILQQRLDVLEQYKSKYLATMAEIEKLENTPADKLNGYNTPTSTNVSSGSSSGSSGSSSKTYTVKSGDTLGGIGSKYGIPWQKIYNANKSIIGSNPNRIYPGQTLTIPGYANGGMVDYTGLAMLHGSKSKPEFVLNNDQMRNMLSSLTRPQTTSNLPTGGGAVNNYNFGNIELPNVTNAKQFVTELKSLVNITKHQ